MTAALVDRSAAGAGLIVDADVAVVAVPLERTIRFGAVSVSEREYVALRLRTASGLEGFALGYTRGLPVARQLAAHVAEVIGADAFDRDAAVARLGPPTDSADVRAVSLVEIALWDLEAKHAEQPLWRLLGGSRDRVPVLAVGGYFLDQRPLSDVEDELRTLVAQGFSHVKVHAHEPDVIERLRAAVGDTATFSIDLHMRYDDLDQAIRECSVLDDLGLGFIEDPFAPDRPGLTAALAEVLRTPVAAGEDAAGADALVALARAADVLRVDATASGGVQAARAAASEAHRLHRSTITHAFVELHAQVAGGTSGIGMAETIPYATGANPVDCLLRSTQSIEAGSLILSQEPGHGLALDWNAVTRFARSATRVAEPKRRDTCS